MPFDEMQTYSMREALRIIASWGCESFSPMQGGKVGAECFRIGNRTEEAVYTADQACAPCLAYKALHGIPVCIEGK